MQKSKEESTWDFSPVHNLLSSLSARDVHATSAASSSSSSFTPTVSKPPDSNGHSYESNSLGNFDRLWDFLGVNREVPSYTAPRFDVGTFSSAQDKDAYTSDGAINYHKPSSKSLHYETDVGNLADVQAEESLRAGLTPNQKRKERRRRAAQREKDTKGTIDRWSDSEDDNNILARRRRSATEIQPKPIAPPAKVDFSKVQEARDSVAKAVIDRQSNNPASSSTPQNAIQPKPPLAPKSNGAASSLRPPQVAPSKSSRTRFQDNSQTLDDFLKSKSHVALPAPKGTNTNKGGQMSHWPTTGGAVMDGTTDSEPSNKLPLTPKPKKGALPFPTINTEPRKQHVIMPLQANAVDRNWQLLLKLLHNFPEERPCLLSPLQLSINRAQPSGIHVFVDASNILIGFYNCLKVSRGYSEHDRIPRPDLAFHALALLLERRRPIAKRVLVGSAPELPAFEQAREVGYETCILDKVWKARELTERQRRFAANSNGGHDGAGSSDNAMDGAGLITKQPKWVEQGVDEILHLKMLESVVDAPSPDDDEWKPNATPPTMVLATGDAAEAEYSQGFKKMVERALRKGWRVELACWAMSVSMEYRRMAQKGAWGERFKIIELDAYSEELFGESV